MADTGHEEAARKKALADEYAKKIRIREQKLKETLSDEQLDFIKTYGHTNTTIFSDLMNALHNPDILPSEYIRSKMNWMFGTVIAKRDRDAILYFADRMKEYPYSDTWFRRSFRAKDRCAYGMKTVWMIRRFSLDLLTDAPLDQILNRELPEDQQAYLDEYKRQGPAYCEWQVAYALDQHNTGAEEAIRRILTEENGSGMLSIALIRGIFISQRSDFHELLGRLLLAARLQEGLRQSICENADCGCANGFITILKVIDENNLIRFSSVKRAVGCWTGLISNIAQSNIPKDTERISGKTVRLICDCLCNPTVRTQYLTSEDAMQIYIALWSLGFDSVESAIGEIARIAEGGSRHQLLVAGYFSENLDLPYISHRIAKRVLRLHRDQDDVLAVWLPSFLPERVYILMDNVLHGQPLDFHTRFDSREEISEFFRMMKDLYSSLSGKSKTFSPCVFPWHSVTVDRGDFAEILCILAALSGEDEKIDGVCGLIKECDSNRRQFYITALLQNPHTEIQRRQVLEGLCDKETYSRKSAYDIAVQMQWTEPEIHTVEGHLRLKGADIRKYAMELLMRQEDASLCASINRLLDSRSEDMRLGGLDLLVRLKKDEKRCRLTDGFRQRLAERAKADDLPSKEKILLDTLVPASEAVSAKEGLLFTKDDHYLPTEFDAKYTELCAYTFADYFPDSKLPELILGKKSGKSLIERLKETVTDSFACKSSIETAQDLMSLSEFIDKHKTTEFVSSSGETMLISNVRSPYEFRCPDGSIPLPDLWTKWAQSNGITNSRLVRAMVLYSAYVPKTDFSEACEDVIRTVFGAGFECGKKLPYDIVIRQLLNAFCDTVPKDDRTRMASALALWFIRCVPDDRVLVPVPDPRQRMQQRTAHLLAHSQLFRIYSWMECKNSPDLKHVFPLAVASAERCADAIKKNQKPDIADETPFGIFCYPTPKRYPSVLLMPDGIPMKLPVGVNAYLFAAYQGILTKAGLYEYLLDSDHIREAMEVVTSVTSCLYDKGKTVLSHDHYYGARLTRRVREFLGKTEEPSEDDRKLLAFVAEVYETVIPIVLSAELSRGDSPTAYSKGIQGIARIYGAKTFAGILSAMGSDTIQRNTFFGWNDATDRKSTLSYLLSVCIPEDGDTADTLRSALEGRKIPTKRLIEAALYSPEWIPIIGRYLKIDAFESVCYYFMAHMNEKFDGKRKAMIARFTPLSEDELNLGAFDINWFRSAYDAIGEKEFNLIYDAAKYITDGPKHSRARKYADAALGRLDVSNTEKAVSDKRNKDLLMAYALIPLEGEDDICRRYLFIRKFQKESRRFGSQRAVSEGKAAEMALKNLATNAGYSDTVRLILRMETKIIDDSRSLFEEKIIDGVSFRIVFDGNGKANLAIKKDGKDLKGIPAKLKKYETVLALSEMIKTLTEQYLRIRIMLEQSMEDQTAFTPEELSELSAHPVVSPMLKNLVLICGDTVGFLSEKGLSDDTGAIHALDPDAQVRIAHPFDLYGKGCWRNYQQILFESRIVQPFRQVFRELYIKTADEIGTDHSLRYAGNQIQPTKTAAVLKSRRWVADVENGLQKVYYKENIVAQIYALADWFSPAEIEAPTLEWVCFSDRKTGKEIPISDVPDIIFSEVMRDVDLAVSVAHAGKVDPETSHSTVEMRAAILSFVLPMFGIGNVKMETHHAIIEGRLADYSVHLGSGVVHQIGGAMIPVLPVHSQHRGRIFLPFTDDDPKTAEIISKVLLFAEDDKIKDPMILSAIRKQSQ
ncbi:MAG: DUF5724 domain-containing protein [Eubacteriales bacterium]